MPCSGPFLQDARIVAHIANWRTDKGGGTRAVRNAFGSELSSFGAPTQIATAQHPLKATWSHDGRSARRSETNKKNAYDKCGYSASLELGSTQHERR